MFSKVENSWTSNYENNGCEIKLTFSSSFERLKNSTFGTSPRGGKLIILPAVTHFLKLSFPFNLRTDIYLAFVDRKVHDILQIKAGSDQSI